MPYITPESIDQARQMDLLTYLRSYEPAELVHISGNVYCTRTHDSLKISNGKWCWFSRSIGGKSALDYLVKVRNLTFSEAVERITGQPAIETPAFNRDKSPPVSKNLLLPERNEDNRIVREYLSCRGIHPAIIDYCIETGRLYEDKKSHNAVFIGHDQEGKPRFCMIRGTGEAKFYQDAPGSDKHHSFSIPAKEPSETLHLFESAIDLLSFATLEHLASRDWHSDNLLSLSGVYKPKKSRMDIARLPVALAQFLQNHPETRTIHLHMDNDLAGRSAAKQLFYALAFNYAVINNPPKFGKDFNDCLQHHVRAFVSGREER
ncbi:MAG: DUF3991 domain-containing protein [Saccharofermentanales bacterium]